MLKLLAIAAGLAIAIHPAHADAKKKKDRDEKPAAAHASSESEQPEPASEPAKAEVAEQAPMVREDAEQAYGEEPLAGSSNGSIRMLLQVRYSATRADASRLSSSSAVAEQQNGTVKANDGYDIQRAFLRYVASPTKSIDAKLLVDFAELKHGQPKQSFKLAYVEAHATKRLQFDIGLLKRPFSLLELLPIAKHELADLGPTDDFIKDQGYAGRDIGVIVRYQPLPSRRMMTVSVGAYRGDLDEGFDASPLKLVGARIETHPVKHLRLGVNAVWRPQDNLQMQETEDANNVVSYQKVVSKRKGAAAGSDVTLAYRHLEIRTELLLGQRTDPIQSRNGKQGSFWSAWVVVAPRLQLGKWWLVPAAKAELLDTDALNPGGQRRSVTGVIGVIPTTGFRLLADVTRTWTDVGLTSMQKVPWTSGSEKAYAPEPSSTRATLQAQLVF